MDGVNIVKMLQMMNVHKMRRTTQNVLSTCPFAPWLHEKGKDDHPSFSVKIDMVGKSVFHCFACKSSGTLLQLGSRYDELSAGAGVSAFVRENENLGDEYKRAGFGKMLDWKKALWLLSSEELKERQKEMELEMKKPFNDDEIKTMEWSKIERFLNGIPYYIISRGITKETAKIWRLGYDKKMGRVVMPILDWRNRLVGYSKRAIKNDPEDKWPKYLNNKGLEKEFFLYGENLIDPEKGDIVVVEGQFDALKVYQAGYNVVAVLGSALTEVQAEKIRKMLPMGKKVIVMGDGDKAGREFTEKALEILKDKVFCIKRDLPDGRDPGELSEKEIKELILRNELK